MYYNKKNYLYITFDEFQEVIPMDYKKIYEDWLANPYFDEATKAELLSIKDDENEIKERFYMDLEFGTRRTSRDHWRRH